MKATTAKIGAHTTANNHLFVDNDGSIYIRNSVGADVITLTNEGDIFITGNCTFGTNTSNSVSIQGNVNILGTLSINGVQLTDSGFLDQFV